MRWPQQRGPLSVLKGEERGAWFSSLLLSKHSASNNGHYFTADGMEKKVGRREKEKTC